MTDAVLVLGSFLLSVPIGGLIQRAVSKPLDGFVTDAISLFLAGLIVFTVFELVFARPRIVVEWLDAGATLVTFDRQPIVRPGSARKWQLRVKVSTPSLTAAYLARQAFSRHEANLAIELRSTEGMELTLDSEHSSDLVWESADGVRVGLRVALPEHLPIVKILGSSGLISRPMVAVDVLPQADDADIVYSIVRDKWSWFWNTAVNVGGSVDTIRVEE